MVRWKPVIVSFLLLICLRIELCVSVNDEGKALLLIKEKLDEDPYSSLSSWDENDHDPCNWFGVGCSADRKVEDLNLKDLCLKGTLAPELGNLIHIKNLILHNNSFYGLVPQEIGHLLKLEVLDLGYNDFIGPLPSELWNIFSLNSVVLKQNKCVDCLLTEIVHTDRFEEIHADEEFSFPNCQYRTKHVRNATLRKLLQLNPAPPRNRVRRAPPPSHAPAPAPIATHAPAPASVPTLAPEPASVPTSAPAPPPIATAFVSPPTDSAANNTSSSTDVPHKKATSRLLIFLSIGGSIALLLLLFAAFAYWSRSKKVNYVMPWTTGLSGQLQKAFVTGIPSLRRSELEAACEDFSNIIGPISNCSLYKGTLSSGVEIAVASFDLEDRWSEEHELQFRKKISELSKVNHKNFMNLIGYCEEEEPFTRMMVFEYAPNGTLFEHLHIKEAEPLEWNARLRIAMGIVYCLGYIEMQKSPTTLRNINSSSIYLMEDYAAKVSDLEFCPKDKKEPQSESSYQDSIVYKFGIILLELISGRLPFSEDDGLLVLWASSYLSGKRPLMGMVDQTLTSVSEETIAALADIIRSCVNENPNKVPTMADVAARMRQITSITPDHAYPRLNPLWWAEIEVITE